MRLLPKASTLAYPAFLLGFTLVAGYALLVGQRTRGVYRILKNPQDHQERHLYAADPALGYAPVPGSLGYKVMTGRAPIPMRHSQEGFRIGIADRPSSLGPRPWVLALGCSYTYGDACLAEDTYAYRVASALGGSPLNAGRNGYGLAQMLVLARTLIPRHHPEFVLVQSSPWLVGRGSTGFARSTFGKVPVPYLSLVPGGKLVLQPPVFGSAVFDLPVERYVSAQRGVGEFTSLLFHVGLPLLVHDDVHMVVYRTEAALGRLPSPGGDPLAINRAVYQEIAAICRENNALMVSVDIRHHFEEFRAEAQLRKAGLVARAQSVLDDLVPERSDDAYYKRFGHWGGQPPELLDTHPNPEAHRIIADTILATIAKGRR